MKPVGFAAGILLVSLALPVAAQQAPARARAQQAQDRARAAMFQRLDVNKDGMLSPEEFRRLPTMRQMRIARQVQRGMRRMDVNRDRSISREEWKGHPEMFDRLDRDRDGKLTPAELRLGRRR